MVSSRYLASAGTRPRFSSAAKGLAVVRLSQNATGARSEYFWQGTRVFYARMFVSV